MSSSRRLGAAQPGPAAPVEGGLDGDGGVAGTVEPQGLPVAGQGRVAADDPGEVVCGRQHRARLEGNSQPSKRPQVPQVHHEEHSLLGEKSPASL